MTIATTGLNDLVPGQIYVTGITYIQHFAMRTDGQWFQRYRENGPRGYYNTKWTKLNYVPDFGVMYLGCTARLPKEKA